MTYELFQKGPAVYIPILLLSIIMTLLVYSAFPLIFAGTRNKIITKRKYNTMCYGINAVGMLFFIALNGASSGAPYLLWTWVFSSAGLRILKKRGVLESFPSVHSDETEISSSNTTTEDNSQLRFCRKCGTELLSGAEFCNKCGTKISEVK